MEITKGMDLKAQAPRPRPHYPARQLGACFKFGPPQQRSGTTCGNVVGMSRRTPAAHAIVESREEPRSGGTREWLPSWRVGVFLLGEGSAEARLSGPTIALQAPGRCLPAALPQTLAPTRLGRHLYSSRPGNRRRRHVRWHSQSPSAAGAEHPGRIGGSLGNCGC